MEKEIGVAVLFNLIIENSIQNMRKYLIFYLQNGDIEYNRTREWRTMICYVSLR